MTSQVFPERISDRPCVLSFLGTDIYVTNDERTQWDGNIDFDSSVSVQRDGRDGIEFFAFLERQGRQLAVGLGYTPEEALVDLVRAMEEQLQSLSSLVNKAKSSEVKS